MLSSGVTPSFMKESEGSSNYRQRRTRWPGCPGIMEITKPYFLGHIPHGASVENTLGKEQLFIIMLFFHCDV